MDTFVQQLINGLTIGAIYALIALGYTMVYGILRLINFAHGDIYMVGAFVGYFLAFQLGFATGPSLLGLSVVLIGSMIAAALVGMAIERFAYRPIRKYARMTTLITAIGVSLLIENLFVARLGAAPRAFPQLLREQSYTLFGNAAISKSQILIFAVSVALMILAAVGHLQNESWDGDARGFVQPQLCQVDGHQHRLYYFVYLCAGFGAGGRGWRADCSIQSAD